MAATSTFCDLRSVPEAARQLTMKPPTVRAWIARRKIAYVKIGRFVRIPQAEIDRVLEEGSVPALPHRQPAA